MTSFGDLYPSKYLSATDLGGRRINLVTIDLRTEEVGKDKELRPVLYFRGAKKGMILNKTNGNKLRQAFGEDVNAWLGQSIELYEAETTFNGETVAAVRIAVPSTGRMSAGAQRPLENASDRQAPPPSSGERLDDDIPF